jgi:hypothetical protein
VWHPKADSPERCSMRAAGQARMLFTSPLYVLCFSDDGPDTGPHPISREELSAAFNPNNGWNVAAIKPDRVQTRYHDDDGAPVWFATIKRI